MARRTAIGWGTALVMLATSAMAKPPGQDIASAWEVKPVVYQAGPALPAPGAEPVAAKPAVPTRPEATRPIGFVTIDAGLPAGKLPDDVAAQMWSSQAPMLLPAVRTWPVHNYYWAASATRHNPLYFEEVNAERYGYTCWAPLQPAVSTAHFFGTLPALPYLMGADCPRECQYTLGHYRPGSCNPWRRHWWPLSLRGAAVQAGVVTGVVFAMP